jgi:FkbM family methyltransferase
MSRRWWQAVRSVTRPRAIRAKRLGLDLKLDLRDDAQYFLFREGYYEPNLSARLVRELLPGDVFVDVGAHVGIHALVAARQLQQLGGGHVFAFEPAADTADRLASAARRNAIDNLTLVRLALGEANTQLELRAAGPFGTDDPAMRSTFGTGRVLGSVATVRFDDWAQDAALWRLDLVKLDVEGGEFAALLGMRQTFATLRPRLVFIEVNPVTLGRAGVTREHLFAELGSSGYISTESIRDHESIENVVFARAG